MNEPTCPICKEPVEHDDYNYGYDAQGNVAHNPCLEEVEGEEEGPYFRDEFDKCPPYPRSI